MVTGSAENRLRHYYRACTITVDMLDPHIRKLLLESLRPPVGYAVESVVVTTFSLDLLTLLTVPLAFTFSDWEDEEGRPTKDPLALLQAVRRNAGCITVFCQAGQIAVPKQHQLLYTYLEDSVFEVSVQRPQGVFHPKVWVLRFVGKDSTVRYRFLCLSRNLTFDRSWDTVLVLDGELTDRRKAIAANHPLGDFVEALPGFALRPVPKHVAETVERMQRELRLVRFELPEEFDDITFWPMGIKGTHSWPFGGRADRMLVMSPFVTERCLTRLTEHGTGHVLISRLDEVGAVDPKRLESFEHIYVLSPDANVQEGADESDSRADHSTPLGLHAKLYLADAGRDARMWTGSANATDAAFNGNVEFLVELGGKKSVMGIDAFLARAEKTASFADLLVPFTPSSDADGSDPVQDELENFVEAARREVALTILKATVTTLKEGGDFSVQLWREGKDVSEIPPQVTIRCWPVTLREDTSAVEIDPSSSEVAVFHRLSFEALTSFFAFEVHARNGAKEARRRFVLNVPLVGVPADRRERILRHLLQNSEQVMRFLLLLLLSEDGGDGATLPLFPRADSFFITGLDASGPGLFEALMRTLDRDPTRLDQVAELVEDLQGATDGGPLLPAGFDLIWGPIWAARRRIQK